MRSINFLLFLCSSFVETYCSGFRLCRPSTDKLFLFCVCPFVYIKSYTIYVSFRKRTKKTSVLRSGRSSVQTTTPASSSSPARSSYCSRFKVSDSPRFAPVIVNSINEQVTQLSQRDCCAGWSSEATYAIHLMLIRKLIVDFLLVIIKLFR